MCLPVLQEDEAARERRFVRALLLAFSASQNRSLFAAKCLVEVVSQAYREGVAVDDVAVMLSLASLQQGGRLLEPLDEDCLLSWVAVIMMALEMVGVPLLPQGEERRRRKEQEGGGAAADDTSSMGQGLKGFVRVAVDQFLAGTDLYRLQLQQSMAGAWQGSRLGDQAGEGDAAGVSPSVRMLQQNTRLVIIALEVVRDTGLPTAVPLQPARAPAAEADGEAPPSEQPAAPEPAQRPGGGVVPGFALGCDPERLAACESKAERQRAAAVRLLIGFMGAAMGWLYSAADFVEQCAECYRQGWTADDLFGKLNDEEFAQSGGVVFKLAPSAGGNVSALVFARWISLCYMALAQLRVPFPGASEQDGWAWVSGASALHDGGESTTLEAYGLADFVVNTIRNVEAREAAAAASSISAIASLTSSSDEEEGEGGREMVVEGILSRPPLGQRPQEGFVTYVEDPRLLASSPTALLMSQQISLVQMTRQLVLQGRAKASA